MGSGLKILVVDVGNTSTAVGLWRGGRVTRVSHCDGGFAEAAAAADAILAADNGGRGVCSPQEIEKSKNRRIEKSRLRLSYVSVVPKMDAKWRRFAKERGLRFHQVSHRDFPLRFDLQQRRFEGKPPYHFPSPTPHKMANGKWQMANATLTLRYPRPETIGADRLADAAGAVSRYGAPVLVMDFGTALTAAVVTRDGVWRGGVIAPGFPLMRDYLFERTAKLPRMELGRGAVPKIGRSTEEAMRFGALVGYRGMVREIVAELERNFGEGFRLVATGGFAKWALAKSGMPFTIDPTLTLHGAALICANKEN